MTSREVAAPGIGVLRRGAPRAQLPAGAMPRYNEVQQKSVHNAYDRDERPFDQIVWDRAQSVEFDIHNGHRGDPEIEGDWYVYHVDAPGFDHTSCTTLSDCLGEMRAYHEAFPQHEVVTIMIDLKDDFAPGHRPEDLDRRIAQELGRDALVTPGDLVGACSVAETLRDAVRGSCGWPRLDALRGKFIVAMTGGECDAESQVVRYVDGGNTALERLGFAAPEVTSSCSVSGYLGQPWLGVVNMTASRAEDSAIAQGAGLVARVYGLDDEESWNAAKASHANLLATNKVNFRVDPWATTHDQHGWPFSCLADGCSEAYRVGPRATSVVVDSGDLTGDRDGFFFASQDASNTEPARWTATVAVEGSHTDDLGKGCLMARADDGEAAPYVAVCRSAGGGPLHVQWRAREGDDTRTIGAESAYFARLTLAPDGHGTRATAESSRDGLRWTRLFAASFDSPLARQGVAASSHGAGAMRFVFGGLTRSGDDGAARAIAAADLHPSRIGACESGDVFDGVLP